MEFMREGEEVNLKRRKSRMKTKKTVVDLLEEDAGESDSEFVKMLKILEDSTSSKNHPYPAILPWKIFLCDRQHPELSF